MFAHGFDCLIWCFDCLWLVCLCIGLLFVCGFIRLWFDFVTG